MFECEISYFSICASNATYMTWLKTTRRTVAEIMINIMQIHNVIKMKQYLYPFKVIMVWLVEYAREGRIRTNIDSRHPTVIKHKYSNQQNVTTDGNIIAEQWHHSLIALNRPRAKCGLFAAAAWRPIFCGLIVAFRLKNFAIMVCNILVICYKAPYSEMTDSMK